MLRLCKSIPTQISTKYGSVLLVSGKHGVSSYQTCFVPYIQKRFAYTHGKKALEPESKLSNGVIAYTHPDFDTSIQPMLDNDVDQISKENFLPGDILTQEHDYEEKRKRQVEYEKYALEQASQRYQQLRIEMQRMGKDINMHPIQQLLGEWYTPYMQALENEQDSYRKKVTGQIDRSEYGPYIIQLKSQKLAIITLHEVFQLLIRDPAGITFVMAAERIGKAIRDETLAKQEYDNMMKTKRKKPIKKEHSKESKTKSNTSSSSATTTTTTTTSLSTSFTEETQQSDKIVEMSKDNVNINVIPNLNWSPDSVYKVGAALLHILEKSCFIEIEGTMVPAFVHYYKYEPVNKIKRGMFRFHELIFSRIDQDHEVRETLHPRYKPMIVPPREWTDIDKGGFLTQKMLVMRTKGSKIQIDCLSRADLSTIYKSLNIMGKVGWRINNEVLDTQMAIWNSNEAGLAGFPSKVDKAIPQKEDFENYGKYMHELKKVTQENSDMYSMRCDTMYKMDLANEFKDDIIYYPYSLDFRGRVYPIPPHLNHLGSDICRGLLNFQKKKPLGKEGLRWLKIHLCGLTGNDKISNANRVLYTEEHIKDIYDSALHPLEGDRWWMKADDPWQCLGACKELVKALESGHPEEFESGLPIHQDGSCNGLQHYAALGLDSFGGLQVNLVPSDKPQDVYSGVLRVVQRKIKEDLQSTDPAIRELATILHGGDAVNRKVIKQTVMTSVYGVTFLGARKQIEGQLKDRIHSGKLDTSEDMLFKLSIYLARLTLESLGETNRGAVQIMSWLNEVAGRVAHENQPMAWITPLGLPIIQPYRKTKSFNILTSKQNLTLKLEMDSQPVKTTRQRTAFPPNFIHSLDSSHMMLTAVACDKLGLTFSSVHDCFWTHACDVNIMNKTLREQFSALYSLPILKDFYTSLKLRYPTITFAPPPERGTLDINCVKQSEYFFN